MTKRAKRGPLANYAFRCKVCAMRFKVRMREDDPDPACPNLDCGAVQTPIGMDVAGGRAPGIGGSAIGKAMDLTANMVMSDYNMTDLASARVGESMAPKLPPHQQARADAMFDPRKRNELFGGAGLFAGAINNIAAAGVANAVPQGGGGIDGIEAIHAQRYRPPVSFVEERKK